MERRALATGDRRPGAVTHGGWLAGLEIGVDRPVTPRARVGAFAGASAGRFVRVGLEGEKAGASYAESGAVPAPTFHGWLGIGLRATLSP